eukprot:TRINITY_DN3009_c0_g1_i3.p1 TRINITY_DN3009_c0_g1~~TRINITY_DN3009_c0_g1_i3.p1  ORF type:complete len:301 (-),score=105.50 TRINITY_DN3009_c0_g1_i3:285-1187(-)
MVHKEAKVSRTTVTTPMGKQYLDSKRQKLSKSKSEYELTRNLLGEGANSKVYLGYSKEGKKVAIKIIRKKGLLPHKLEELRSEIEVLETVSNLHTNICSLLAVEEDEEIVKLVFDYFPTNLFDLCSDLGRLYEHEARPLFSQIVDAVQFLHTFKGEDADGICHRDLKLENIMLNEDRTRPLLIDFGFSTFMNAGEMLNKQCGSFHYVCPEIARHQYYDGKKVDMWALGCILYCMVVGRQPFDSEFQDELFDLIKKGAYFPLPKDLTAEARDLIENLLQVNPSKRLTIEEVKSHPWLKKKS